MSQNALEAIKAIQEKAAKEIEALKSGAISELVKKLSEAKEVVKGLEAEYESLTGKTLKGEKISGTRERLTGDEKAALVLTVTDIVKNSKNGVKMGEIVKATGKSATAVRDAVSQVSGLSKTGNKASTLYFLK